VIDPGDAIEVIRQAVSMGVDWIAVGKWNHAKEAARIDWPDFLRRVRAELKTWTPDRYLIKRDLLRAGGEI
jgi:hypothetical protein